jgi:ribonuclease HI
MPKRSSSKSKVYAVAVGRQPGIYHTWDECKDQVHGYPKSVYKSFLTRQDAEQFISQKQQQSGNIPTVGAASGSIETENRTTKRRKVGGTNNSSMVQAKAASPVEKIEPDDDCDGDVNCHNDSKTKTPSAASTRLPLPHKLWFHINFDGGSRENPNGVAGAGTHVLTRRFCELHKSHDATATTTTTVILRTKTDIRTYLGNNQGITNNQAEYEGAIAGLEYVLQTLKSQPQIPRSVQVIVQGDSNLVIQQMKGNWACRSSNLQPLFERAKRLVRDMELCCVDSNFNITYEHVYRSDNKIADALANQAMDAQKSWTTEEMQEEDDNDNDGHAPSKPDTPDNGDGGTGGSKGRKVGKIIHI